MWPKQQITEWVPAYILMNNAIILFMGVYVLNERIKKKMSEVKREAEKMKEGR